mgnify:CR=1 FL=1
MSYTSAMRALHDEVVSARTQFPRPSHTLIALAEEYGELAEALLDKHGKERVQAEALQVAAVAIRFFEEGDDDYGVKPHAENYTPGPVPPNDLTMSLIKNVFIRRSQMLDDSPPFFLSLTLSHGKIASEIATSLSYGLEDVFHETARFAAIETAVAALLIYERGDDRYPQDA